MLPLCPYGAPSCPLRDGRLGPWRCQHSGSCANPAQGSECVNKALSTVSSLSLQGTGLLGGGGRPSPAGAASLGVDRGRGIGVPGPGAAARLWLGWGAGGAGGRGGPWRRRQPPCLPRLLVLQGGASELPDPVCLRAAQKWTSAWGGARGREGRESGLTRGANKQTPRQGCGGHKGRAHRPLGRGSHVLGCPPGVGPGPLG